MGLVADMQALGAAFGDVERDPDVRARPKVGPRMVTGFQPFHLGRQLKPAPTDLDLLEEAGFFSRIRAAVDRSGQGEALAGLGLSIARNHHSPPRYGLKGLPADARNAVSESLQLLEERRPLLSFWTVTAPRELLLALAAGDSWPEFVRRLMQKLRRRLVKRLGVALYVGVVELQPKRSRAIGIPCPHLHVVFLGRSRINGAWAISPAELDAMIKSAALEVGVPENVSFKSAGNVQRVKKSVRAYLSKYMTKGSSDVERWVGTEWESLLPRQWWVASRAMRELLSSCTVQLPTGFLAWAWRHRVDLLQRGVAYLQECVVPPEAPATYRFCWGSASRLAALVAEWMEWMEDLLITTRREIGIWSEFGEFRYAKPLACDRFPVLSFEVVR